MSELTCVSPCLTPWPLGARAYSLACLSVKGQVEQALVRRLETLLRLAMAPVESRGLSQVALFLFLLLLLRLRRACRG